MGNIKFDKNETKTVTSDLAESKELNEAEAIEAQTDAVNSSDNTSSDSENASEAEASKADEKKAVLSYIGNGVWIDAMGKAWSRVDNTNANILSTRSYAESEYEQRNDLKFMVKYGEMKLSLV